MELWKGEGNGQIARDKAILVHSKLKPAMQCERVDGPYQAVDKVVILFLHFFSNVGKSYTSRYLGEGKKGRRI